MTQDRHSLVARLDGAMQRLNENLASFDAEVASELMSEGERADLWGDIDVNVEDLRVVLAAAALSRPEQVVADEAWKDDPSARKRGSVTAEQGNTSTWRTEIKRGPDGEENYAWVYADDEMIGTFKTHRARQIVDAMNLLARPTSDQERAAPAQQPVAWRYLSGAKNAKWTVQKNYPAHLEKWDGYRIEPLYTAPSSEPELRAEIVRLQAKAGEDGPETYDWSEGIAP